MPLTDFLEASGQPSRMRIYVAGPYSAPTLEGRIANTNAAIDAGLALMRMGHAPYIPHLSHYSDERALEIEGERRAWNDWMALGLEFLDQCQGFLYLGKSTGTDIELQRATKRGLRLFFSLEDVPDATD